MHLISTRHQNQHRGDFDSSKGFSITADLWSNYTDFNAVWCHWCYCQYTFKWPKFTAACIWLVILKQTWHLMPHQWCGVFPMKGNHKHVQEIMAKPPTATCIKSMRVDVVSNILYKYYIVNIRSMSACEFTIMDLWEWEKTTILCVLTQVWLEPGVEGQSLLVTTEARTRVSRVCW